VRPFTVAGIDSAESLTSLSFLALASYERTRGLVELVFTFAHGVQQLQCVSLKHECLSTVTSLEDFATVQVTVCYK
jgi:hypothetical protein